MDSRTMAIRFAARVYTPVQQVYDLLELFPHAEAGKIKPNEWITVVDNLKVMYGDIRA